MLFCYTNQHVSIFLAHLYLLPNAIALNLLYNFDYNIIIIIILCNTIQKGIQSTLTCFSSLAFYLSQNFPAIILVEAYPVGQAHPSQEPLLPTL